MTRDFVGYGATPPHPRWPGGARVAVNFVINFEEGSELSHPAGDGISETGLRPDAIGKYIGGEAGDASFLVVASRPSDELQSALETARRWFTFSPQRLDVPRQPPRRPVVVDVEVH